MCGEVEGLREKLPPKYRYSLDIIRKLLPKMCILNFLR